MNTESTSLQEMKNAATALILLDISALKQEQQRQADLIEQQELQIARLAEDVAVLEAHLSLSGIGPSTEY